MKRSNSFLRHLTNGGMGNIRHTVQSVALPAELHKLTLVTGVEPATYRLASKYVIPTPPSHYVVEQSARFTLPREKRF